MMRSAVILGLILTLSGASYAQDDNFNGSTANWDNPWEQQLRWYIFLLKPQEEKTPTFALQNKRIVERVDPGMPVIVLLADESTQLPIQVNPEDLPFFMPISNLPV